MECLWMLKIVSMVVDWNEIGERSLRNILENLSSHFKIKREDNGLFLSPYPH